ncbi:MAG TPA: AAA-like domain-containing protein [Candidatus Angelobacter sp.]|jgi:hypothetical protein|nr:AAA-like domain-containing protein [Candidatus Angelobacter sp.]
MSSFFVTGGTMKPDAPSYVHRAADDELYSALLAAEYCSVLTTRQMGKSSLMARTAVRLREQGIRCATVDLQGRGQKNTPPEQWYYGFVKQVADGLELPGDWPEWWKQQEKLLPVQRMTDFFADVVLKQIAGRVVVFIDEVDWMIRLPFSDEFFAAIRSCYNRRATEPQFDRLSFVLLGSAAPAQLIKDATRTPFNIGRGIELTDFTPEEAKLLAQPLGESGGAVLSRILYWTDGHPYLTQMLLAKLTNEDHEPEAIEILVDGVVEQEFFSSKAILEENNLKFVKDRLTQASSDLRKVLLVYRDVLHGRSVKDVPASPIHTSLRLSGVVKPDIEQRLHVRNRIYRYVFDERWLGQHMPINLKLIIGAAVAAFVVTISSLLVVLKPAPMVVHDGLYSGPGSCSAAACHGGVNKQPRSQTRAHIWQNESFIWATQDPHFRAFITLGTSRSKTISYRAERPIPPTQDPKCLSCHTLAVPENLRDRPFGFGESVSCESCHGPASGWLQSHFQIDAKPKDLVLHGMYNISNMVLRAEKCLECHLGTGQTQEVDHKMIVAGHPDLLFELSLFSTKEPPHWQDDASIDPSAEARLWAIGQIVQLREALKRLEHHTNSNGPKWLEWSEFNCSDCHLPKNTNTRLSYHQHLGIQHNSINASARWSKANYPLVRILAKQIDPAVGKELDTQLAHLDELTSNNQTSPKEIGDNARRIGILVNYFVGKINTLVFDSSEVAYLLNAISSDDGIPQEGVRYAEQAAMSLESLFLCYKKMKNGSNYGKLQVNIDRLLDEFPDSSVYRTYDAQEFTVRMLNVNQYLGYAGIK